MVIPDQIQSLFIMLSIAIVILLLIVGCRRLDVLLNKKWYLKPKREVFGYTKKGYVNKIHEWGLLTIDTFILLILLLGISSWMVKDEFLLLKVAIFLLPIHFIFDGVVTWIYPVQSKEYKKTIVYVCLSVIAIPIFLASLSFLGVIS